MKQFEGKTVWLKPTGNNCRRHDDKPIKAEIIKVARVNVTYKLSSSNYERQGRFKGDYIGELNRGYKVFETLEDYNNDLVHSKLSRKLSTKYRYSLDYQNVPLEKLKQVADLLGVVTDEQ